MSEDAAREHPDAPDAAPSRLRLGFQAKILLALVGTVILLMGTSLWVIRHEMETQVDLVVERAADRAGRAMAEVEQLRAEELDRIGRRFTGSIRLLAALDAALEEDDAGVLTGVAEDELALAGLTTGFVSFLDLDGQEVVTLVDGRVAERSRSGEGGRLARRLLAGNEARLTGYEIRGDRLYSVQSYILTLFEEPLGALTVGFPLDDAVAARLREVVDAELCFIADGVCVAGTGAAEDPAFRARLAGDPDARIVDLGGRRWAFTSAPLGGADSEVRQALAVPLDEVLRPFDRIERVERLAGLGAVLLALLLGTALARGLTGPVRTLVGATERVRRGEYDFRVDIRSRDEIQELGESFNGMIADLALKERYRGVLDKVLSRDVAEEMLSGEIRLGGEVREVTTLFADVRGFTSLSEGMDSPAIISMLNEWFDQVAEPIEREAGIVDKFLGDGVMAVFGAPIEQEDHAIRAVRAALAIRDDLITLNQRRRTRGQPALDVGIGLATGSVVAGNTGARNRLNYTVLGESVNLAARLCSAAGASRILVSDETRRAVVRCGADLEGSRGEPLHLKGLSAPVRPWRVEGIRAGGASRSKPALAAALLTALGLTLGAPGPGAAQVVPELPTLADLGAEYISSDGHVQLLASGQLDVEAYLPGDDPAWLVPETSPFPAGRLRLFLDLFVGDRFYASVEGRADRGQAPAAGPVEARLQQAFVRFTPTEGGTFHLQAGKFISPFGNVPMRRRTDADPFIRPPIGYDHRTVVSTTALPVTADDFLGWRERSAASRGSGAPIVWDTPYPAGLMIHGARGQIDYRFAVVNSAPSSEPAQWALLSDFDPSVIARLGYQPIPELHLATSYNRGPYLRPEVEADEAWGTAYQARSYRSYPQEMLSVEATYTRGRAEARAELIRDRWAMPSLPKDPVDLAWFIESRVRVLAGAFGALRYSGITYGALTRSDGARLRWDHPVHRWQVAAGYRLSHNLEVRGELLVNRAAPEADLDTHLAAMQMWWRF